MISGRRHPRLPGLPVASLLFATVAIGAGPAPAQSLDLKVAEVEYVDLPKPVSNNAVAALGDSLHSFLGLSGAKTHDDIVTWHFSRAMLDSPWGRRDDVPVDKGRLAASAVDLGDVVILIGGYTVAADGAEVSTPEVFAVDPVTHDMRPLAPMPVPVDDAVAIAHESRWIYLVSGWHDLANVNLVQLYDARKDRWTQATMYPGEPVFGHAGGGVGNDLLICDGVRVALRGEGRRAFEMTDGCYAGRIDDDDKRRIAWSPVPAHPGKPRYRMAATGTTVGGPRVLFAGGSTNPYNYDGIGYNGEPSQPERGVFSYAFAERRWEQHGALPVGTMDHRGLPEVDGRFHLIGGMGEDRQVRDQVVSFRLGPTRTR